MAEEDHDSEQSAVPKDPRYPVKVEYCGVCGMPPEFCEYGGSWAKCRTWIESNLPELFAKLGLSEVKVDEKQQEKEKAAERKEKKQEAPAITIELVERTKRKRVTYVIGLEQAGVKLADAAKACRKKMATGCNPSKEKGGCLIVQGDHADELKEFLKATFPGLAKLQFNFTQGAKMYKDDEEEAEGDDDEDGGD